MEWENTPNSIEHRGSPRRGRRRAARRRQGGLGSASIVILALISYFTGINPSRSARRRGNPRPAAPRAVQAAGRQRRPARRRRRERSDAQTFVAHVLGETEAVWTRVLPAQKGVHTPNATLVLYSGATYVGLRRRAGGDGAVLLPGGQEGLSRHVVLPRHADQIRRRRRLRLRLRDRARNRPSRAGSARHSRQGRRGQAERHPHPGQRASRCASS